MDRHISENAVTGLFGCNVQIVSGIMAKNIIC
jgi:hypothetical protein